MLQSKHTKQLSSNHQDRLWQPLGEEPNGKNGLVRRSRVLLSESSLEALFVHHGSAQLVASNYWLPSQYQWFCSTFVPFEFGEQRSSFAVRVMIRQFFHRRRLYILPVAASLGEDQTFLLDSTPLGITGNRFSLFLSQTTLYDSALSNLFTISYKALPRSTLIEARIPTDTEGLCSCKEPS